MSNVFRTEAKKLSDNSEVFDVTAPEILEADGILSLVKKATNFEEPKKVAKKA